MQRLYNHTRGIHRCFVIDYTFGICEISMRQKQSVKVNAFLYDRLSPLPHPVPQSLPHHRWVTGYTLLGVACLKVLPSCDASLLWQYTLQFEKVTLQR